MKDEDELDRIARDRHELHVNHPSHRQLAPDYERKGLAGEKALADFFGTEIDKVMRPDGDGGRECIVYIADNQGRELRCKVDVKCAGKPKYLLVEKVKALNPLKRARIYVLARYLPFSRTAQLLGWAWLGEVLKGDDFFWNDGRHFLESFSIPAGNLRDMQDLRDRFLGVEDPNTGRRQ